MSNNEQQFTDADNERLHQKLTRLRKSGKPDEAWTIGVEEVQKNPQDNYLKGAFFWVCYDCLKIIQNPIIERGKSNKNFYPQQHEAEKIGLYLDWIIWLDLPVGGFEYPRLLFLFRQNTEYFPQIINLVLKLQLDLFDDEAKEPFKTEKGEVPSLILTYARKLAQYWIGNKQRTQAELEMILSFMDAVRSSCKDTQHKIWLDYDQAKCFVLANQYDKARKLVIPILKKKQREAWAWGALAATYRTNDEQAAICLFSQAINCAHEDSFALPALKSLALLLSSKGLNREASMCVKRSIACYESNGWKIKEKLQTLTMQPWYDINVDIKQLPSYLKESSVNASQYLHGETVSKTGLVVALHQSGKGCNVYFGPNNISPTPLFLVKGKKPKVGDFLQLVVPANNENGDVISAVICEPVTLNGVGTIQGELRVTDKGFGFVDDIFIHASLITGFVKNEFVDVVYYSDLDRKKGKLGKKAATITLAKNR